jgi:hypothetical protein
VKRPASGKTLGDESHTVGIDVAIG